jgi:hypothetical protein
VVLNHFLALVITAFLADPVGELPLTALGATHHSRNGQFEMGAALAFPRLGCSPERYRHVITSPCSIGIGAGEKAPSILGDSKFFQYGQPGVDPFGAA